ncbi:sugar lyase [Labilibacter sediminis]|nr:sugar lyase [Labilibacter sediminis]
MKIIKLFMLVILLLPAITHLKSYAQYINHPIILSFEDDIPENITCTEGSGIKVSEKHFKHGSKSLQWSWKADSRLNFNSPINSKKFDSTVNDKFIPTFVFWIYNENPINDKLTFKFKTANTTNCQFEYDLNFSGWRGAWIAFERDMQGKPEPTMDNLEITAPGSGKGSLYLDHVILCIPMDNRWHTPDYQAPFINKKTKNHWLELYNSSQNTFDLEVKDEITQQQIDDIEKIEHKFKELIFKPINVDNRRLENIQNQFSQFNISKSGEILTGKNLWFARYAEIYDILQIDSKGMYKKYGQDIRHYCDFMFEIANAYCSTTDSVVKNELKNKFLLLTEHIFDQGWQEGSSMGTLHHLGYSFRNFYRALFLFRDELTEAGLTKKAQKAMEWFSGTGEVKLTPENKGISIDAYNTSVIGRLASILMMPDSPKKVTYLKCFSRYIDNGLQIADGLEDSFKPDGSIFHHGNHYPAYAVGGLDGAVNMVWCLNNTEFEVSRQGKENLKNALLTFRLYCNLQEWPLSISGRHPKGTGKLKPWHFAKLATTGSPDKTETIDTDLAGAYLRLTKFDQADNYSKLFKETGINVEPDPSGNWSMNYASLGIHRRNNWMATVRGHSRYIWAAETYINANWYGRYLAHGHLQIMANGKPVNNFDSGYQQIGWDWNRWPGTTVINLPFNKLIADVKKVDQFSGFEEMLFSDEAFAGALSFENKHGMYAMKLHEHDKYNGSHRAHKSFFFFDNRIICLGSNIENVNTDNHTETILFQDVLKAKHDTIMVNGNQTSSFPYSAKFKNEKLVWISDNQGIFYYIPDSSNIWIEKKKQYSFDQSSRTPTEGDFMTGVINHGKAPKNRAYEYCILVKPSIPEAKSFASLFKTTASKPYSVLQKDSTAHIVHDKKTDITAYALFKENHLLKKGVFQSVSAPVMAMSKMNNDTLQISICDPDLHLYEGNADVLLDTNAKRIERSIYSRPWFYKEGAVSKIIVCVHGVWNLKNKTENCTIIHQTNKTTTLELSFQHGLSREVNLIAENDLVNL